MERKMHEQSTLVSNLIACKVPEKRIEAERSKLRQYELIRFKEFRRSMIEKIRRRTAKRKEKKLAPIEDELLKPSLVSSEIRITECDDSNKGQAENVEMQIDVQVSIESGQCTLRTAQKQESLVMIPIIAKKPSSIDLRAKAFASSNLANLTRFSIPRYGNAFVK
ncbi:hypothetical protein DICVIV_02061 [Dictyocaulus viviparus]|uniref:Uncharacterized protein n=1 Tax=Dictyocaulus viviparus TaxID=29172 RepID=A0A0D8Y4W1_DICVI|nr:hypothetical protein DICVIV_02061 [Dictyocaulus viviparus]